MGFLESKFEEWSRRVDFVLIAEHVKRDASWQTTSLKAAMDVLTQIRADGATAASAIDILDLGCGNGNSFDALKQVGFPINWMGLDLKSSPEVDQRVRTDLNFVSYDGQNIPFADHSFDMVYSRAVFEHVLQPKYCLDETFRVLRPGGILVGSTSQLEPFHSRSTWNYTPYGFVLLMREAGFESIELRPGIDGLTLIVRRIFMLMKLHRLFNPFFDWESPLNLAIEFSSRTLGASAAVRNWLKLLFCGHFVFLGRKLSSSM